MSQAQGEFIKFLGTAGARFVMIKQLRASGGIWVSANNQNILIDPGPGSIVQCNRSRPKLDPCRLDAIILSHRHLDHSGDVNVMIEAMTEGGFKKRGILFCPKDALDKDPIILKHTRNLLGEVQILKANSAYRVGDFLFHTSMPHIHPVSTYGIKFKIGKLSISILTDTKYFPKLKDFYSTDVLIISLVFYHPRPGVEHFSLTDAKQVIAQTKPQKAILTHFGMTMLRARPHLLAQRLTKELDIEVKAAYDGMSLQF
ncbi:MAG: MBL fold metallo-hydrolase [Candidatus Omnitrophota bacterium]|jgi:phosphoribosyl 1,2-cyclic phosphodiesterase